MKILHIFEGRSVIIGFCTTHKIPFIPHPYGMRSERTGFSHGLKSVHWTLFTPVCALVPSFRIPIRRKFRRPQMWSPEFWSEYRDSNCVISDYLIFLEHLSAQTFRFVQNIPLLPTMFSVLIL